MPDRRNKRRMPIMPIEGAEMVACAYGIGNDDYLAVVLAFVPAQVGDGPLTAKYVSWIWNSAEGCEGIGEGHYIPRFSFETDEAWIDAVWADFGKRAKRFVESVPMWVDWERAQDEASNRVA